ncbi:MAG: hypothetical protein FWD17_00075, partial [Polyangiaceae bacterium]|nr:hypothetical protein [Polyangiaceae bacterium]
MSAVRPVRIVPASRGLRVARALVLAASAVLVQEERTGHAAAPAPPWTQPGEVPPPSWARSVIAATDEIGQPREITLQSGPSRTSSRRGVVRTGASLPFFGEKRGPGCSGAWWLVGPWAWTCSDDAVLSPAAASVPTLPPVVNGLEHRYFFIAPAGASAFSTLEGAREGTEDQQLEGGWAVGATDERETGPDEHWVRTSHGLWIARRQLVPAQPSSFHGETLAGASLDVAWIVNDRAPVWASPSRRGKPTGSRSRFDRVVVRGEARAEATA